MPMVLPRDNQGEPPRLYYERSALIKAEPEKLDWLLRDVPQGARALDFGAGTGKWAAVMLERRPDITVDVLDAEAHNLDNYYDKIPGLGERYAMDFSAFRAPASYDAIWARGGLFFLPQAELSPVLESLADALKPGGVLQFNFIESIEDTNFNLHPLPRDVVKSMVEKTGLIVEEIIDVERMDNDAHYGRSKTFLPTYIVRARKK